MKRDGKWFMKLVFEKEVKLEKKEPKGIDIGYRKLIAMSDRKIFRREVKEIIEKGISNRIENTLLKLGRDEL